MTDPISSDLLRTSSGGVAAFRRRADGDRPQSLSESVSNSVLAFERVIASGNSECILLWPQALESVAVLHSLAALGRLGRGEHRLTTLFYPWNRNTPGLQTTILVDRDFIDAAARRGINQLYGDPNSPTFGYLMALHSLSHLFSSGKKNKSLVKALAADPTAIHPSVFEISPQIGIYKDETRGYEGQFLRRLRKHTWISERPDRVDASIDFRTAPFFMFGVHHDAASVSVLRRAGLDPRREGRAPDLVLLDITRRARDRIGSWRQVLPGFLSVLTDLYGPDSPPVLAVTDDCFPLEALRWEVVKRYDVRRRRIEASDKRPAPSRAILAGSPDPLNQTGLNCASPIELRFEVYGSDLLSFVETGLALRRQFLNASDAENAELVTRTIAIAQTLVGLPGSSRQLHEFLAANYQGLDLTIRGARFDHQAVIVAMRAAIAKGLSGPLHGALTRFMSGFESLCVAAEANSSSRRLFDQWGRRLTKDGIRTIFVCSSDFLRAFIAWRFETDPEFAADQEGFEREVVLADRRDAIEYLTRPSDSAVATRVFFIEPTTDDLLHVLAVASTPLNAIVLANLARTEQMQRRVKILQALDGTEPVRILLAQLEGELVRVLAGRISQIPNLEADITLPRAETIDLTATGSAGYGQRRTLGTSSGLTIRAFDGTELAFYEPDAVQSFSRRYAKDLKPGDQVCVFNQDFVAAARERLNLTADAPEILAEYHNAVSKAVAALPGKDLVAKVAELRKRMLALDPTVDLPSDQAIRYWINIAHLGNVPRDRVKPQAPRDLRHFLCFMKALGISEAVASHYWSWGVFWTRSMRISTGSWFHQIFLGILIDPHGTASRLAAGRQAEAWRIYDTATQYLVTVVSNEVEAVS